MRSIDREKFFEIIFLTVFSAFILLLFFSLLSMNGLVLGNDPAVHMKITYYFLENGRIPLGDIVFYPPLYHIVFASFMAFTGVAGVDQTIFLIKSITAVINWLVIMSVYVFGAKFFGKKIGIIASILLLFLFPLYEINFWGGYPSLLSFSFMILLFMFLSIEMKDLAQSLLIFMFAFSLVLSHQLTTFISVLIVAPFLIIVAVKYRGRLSKTWIAAIFGGLLAFFLYYSQTIIPHLNDILVIHILADVRSLLYQVPFVSFEAFVLNFGFILFFATIGIFLTFRKVRKRRKHFFLLLVLSFLVPMLLSQSYLFGIYLPYQRFIYYLLPSLAIFGAVCLSYVIDFVISFFYKKNVRLRGLNLRIATIIIIVLLSAMFVIRFGVVYGKIMESSVYYSTSDIKAYEAGMWLQDFCSDDVGVVTTEIPGSWLDLFSGKSVIAAIDTASGRNDAAETVLDLAYELENPLFLVRSYDFRGDISDETHVSIDHIWYRVSYSSGGGNFVTYSVNGIDKEFALSNLNREIVFETESFPKKLTIHYANSEIAISQTILAMNNSYPLNVTWTLAPVENQISNVALYVSTFFDLFFSFEEAYVPGVLDWENPWVNPSTSQGNNWAVVNFSRSILTDQYLGFYDEKEEVIYAMKFEQLPDWGNVGVLASRQIDAVRFQYHFDLLDFDQKGSFTYQVLTFSRGSYPEMPQRNELADLFEFKPQSQFEIKSRDYNEIIREGNIKFIVYDKNELDTKLVYSEVLELVYSNDRYAIFRVKDSN